MNAPIQEVYSQLLPVDGGKLIVPRVSVAEVTGYVRPRRDEAWPNWFLGMMNWSRQEIPLISFEGMCGRAVPERRNRTRIAIVYALLGRLQPNVFAIMTQGYPYLIRVNANVLSLDQGEPYAENGPFLTRLRMANERPLVPDLERMENLIGDVLGLPAVGSGTGYGLDEQPGEGDVAAVSVAGVEVLEEDPEFVDGLIVDEDEVETFASEIASADESVEMDEAGNASEEASQTPSEVGDDDLEAVLGELGEIVLDDFDLDEGKSD